MRRTSSLPRAQWRRHARQPLRIGHEIDLTLLMRTGDAQCAQLRRVSKQDAADEHSAPAFVRLREARTSARQARFRCKWYRLPRSTDGRNRNGYGACERNITGRRRRSRKLGPRAAAEAEKRKPSCEKTPSRVHVIARCAAARSAPRRSACAWVAILSETGCALSLSWRQRRTQSVRRCSGS